MESNRIYGTERIAGYLGVSEATFRRWLKTPAAQCFQVGSMDNAGGGYGRGRVGEVKSLDYLRKIMRAHTSEERKKAAHRRWGYTDVSSRSNLKNK